MPQFEAEGARVGHGGRLHAYVRGSLLISAARQFGEAVGLQDLPDRRRAQGLILLRKRPPDIVDGAVLLAQGIDVSLVIYELTIAAITPFR